MFCAKYWQQERCLCPSVVVALLDTGSCRAAGQCNVMLHIVRERHEALDTAEL